MSAAIIDFDPSAVMFKPHQFWQVVWSNIGIAIWIGGLTAWASQRGFWEVLTLYIVPYLWYKTKPLLRMSQLMSKQGQSLACLNHFPPAH